MHAEELKKMDRKELERKLQELRSAVSGARFALAARKQKSIKQLRMDKKDIARILTVLKETK